MADNLAVTPGVGASVAADDVDGILYQRIKLAWGVDGSAVDASASNPLPVTSVITSLPALPAGSNVIGAVTGSGNFAITAVTLPLPTGAATEATLGNILTKLGTARTETLWTDDTGAYFVRVDNAGTITWTDTSGTTSSAPGTGSRPAAGATILLDRSSYQAIAAATGYSIGDLLDHIVTTDPATGAVIAHFWLNTTTEAKLASAPSAANITPLSPLPSGAATAANQATANTSLAAIAAAAASSTPSPVYLATDGLSNNGTTLTPQFAKIAASASGANTVVAAVTGKKIRVLGYTLMGNGAVNANFQSHTTTATATGLDYIAAAGGGICVPFSPTGWFETVAGEALDINLSAAVAVGGQLVYVAV